MRHIVTLFVLFAAMLGGVDRLGAQGHATHRHPPGAKIIMTGTLVEPLCHFGQGAGGPALQDCLKRLSDQQLQPALLGDDSTLYVLRSPSGSNLGTAQVRRLLGQPVKVDGTVFPAGSAYLIVVDSLRVNTP